MSTQQVLRDLHRIQTCNLLSRNQVLYSIELGGHYIRTNYVLSRQGY